MALITPRRGEIWNIRFDPSIGDEIRKDRRAVVMNVEKAGRLKLRMVVPITTGNLGFRKLFWMVEILADSKNGLDHDSYADAFQFKSVSTDRFINRTGFIADPTKINDIASAIVLCIGYSLPSS